MQAEKTSHYTNVESESDSVPDTEMSIDVKRCRYPYCVVWTPIPIISWIIPFIGHMGIALSTGVIRDFAGSYYVSEDNMGFGKPTKYWKLDSRKVTGGQAVWDESVTYASEVYSEKVHNLFCDNCHSHVALALNSMKYDRSHSWNMVKLCLGSMLYSKYVSFGAFLKTYVPFVITASALIGCIVYFSTH